MFSIYIIYVYLRGVWGATAPQKPTTHYKNKIKWRLFLYWEPGYFFIFSQARPGFFFALFRDKLFLFYSLQRQVIFFFQNQRQEFFLENNPAPPPPRISNGRPLSFRSSSSFRSSGILPCLSGISHKIERSKPLVFKKSFSNAVCSTKFT